MISSCSVVHSPRNTCRCLTSYGQPVFFRTPQEQRVKFLQLLSTKPSDKEHVGAPSNMLPLGISTKLNRGPSQSRHSKYLSPFINLCLQSVIAEPAGKARQRSFIAKQNRPRQPRSQGLSPLPPLSSTTREAEERDPGNEVVDPKYFGCDVSVRLYRL